MSVRCLIVDDEPPARELLEKHISLFDDLELSATAANAIKAMELLQSQPIDLMFLDIEMPRLSGLDLLKTLSRPPKIVITTAYRDYAIEGYDLDIVDYLLKPISFERFTKSVDRYYSRAKPVVEHKADAPVFFYVNVNKKNVRVNFQDILFVESLKDYTRLHLHDKKLITKGNVGKMQALLPQEQFLRVHRSYIVSLQKITAFTQHDIEIGDIEIPIGSSYKETVLESLKK